MDNFFVISGCSGGGKSTLLAALAERGFGTVEEPGRRIVQAQTMIGGSALPWLDLEAFLDEAISLAKNDYETARTHRKPVFFDRGLIDAASALRHLGKEQWFETLRSKFRYRKTVFLTPPWPEIYVTDGERRHRLNEAVEEYERLHRDYEELGYETMLLPKLDVDARVTFILRTLETS